MVLARVGIKTVVLVSVLLLAMSSIVGVAYAADNMYAIAAGSNSTGTAKYGWNVTYAGDFNGDNIPDVVVGAPGENSAYLFLGPVANLNAATPDLTFTQGSEFGASVDWAQDINGDNFDDVIIGAPGEDRAYLYYGSGTPEATVDVTFTGPSGSRFGTSVCGIGDFTSDTQYMDIAIGAPLDDVAATDAGAVFIYSSVERARTGIGATLASTVCNWNLTGANAGDRFGYSLAAGVISADQFPDLIVGAPFFDVPNSPTNIDNAGAVYYQAARPHYVSGLPNPMSADMFDLKIYGPMGGARFGWDVSNLTNMGGSPGEELIVGAPRSGSGGNAYIFFDNTIGSAGSLLNLSSGGSVDHTIMAANAGDKFGYSVSWAGNIDGQGTEDVAVGAPSANANGTAYVFYTPLSGANVDAATADAMFIGESADDYCGASLCGAGKSTAANTDMLLIGAPAAGGGKAYLSQVNMVPVISYDVAPAAPASGNESTTITITATYADNEEDAPASSLVHVYNETMAEISGSPFTLTAVAGTPDYRAGHDYEYTGTFPHGLHSFQFEFAAATGDMAAQLSPMVYDVLEIDGVAPAQVNLHNHTAYLNTTSYEYAIELRFTWPADDAMMTSTGDCTWLAIKWSNSTEVNLANWDTHELIDTKLENNNKQSLAYSEWYLSQPPGTAGDEMVIVYKDLNPGETYYFAAMVRDEKWNWAPISDPISVQPYMLPDHVAPTRISYIDAYDAPDDDGGKITLTWDVSTETKFSHYNIYYDTEEFDNVTGMTADVEVNYQEETEINVTGLTNGEYYYFGVTAIDLAGNEDVQLDVTAGPVRCLDNGADIPAVVTGVTAEDNPADSDTIIVTWDTVDFADFDAYKIYVSTSAFTTLNPMDYEVMVDTKTTGTYTVNTSGGSPLNEGQKYYFAVTAMSFNNQENLTITADMWDGPVYPKDTTDSEVLSLVTGVSAGDKANDGGGAITVTWDVYNNNKFGFYNIYMSETEVDPGNHTTDDMTLVSQIATRTKGSTVITEFDGAPLVNGQLYYGVVALESWNGVVNTAISAENNFFMVEPINNTDDTGPDAVEGFAIGEYGDTWFIVEWTPFTASALPDFDQYLITYWIDGQSENEKIVLDITQSELNITVMYEGTEYLVTIVCLDDAGNFGAVSAELNVTTRTGNVKPFNLDITMTPDTDIEVSTEITFEGYAEDDAKSPSELEYYWDFDASDGLWWDSSMTPADGEGAIGQSTKKTYSTENEAGYTVTMKVRDGTYEEQATVTVSVAPSGGGGGGGGGSEDAEYMIYIVVFVVVAVVFLIVIIGVVVFFILKGGKKKPADETPAEGEGDAGMSAYDVPAEGTTEGGAQPQPMDQPQPVEDGIAADPYAAPAGPDGVVDPYAAPPADQQVDPMAEIGQEQPVPMDQPQPMPEVEGAAPEQLPPTDPAAAAAPPAEGAPPAGQPPAEGAGEEDDLFGPI